MNRGWKVVQQLRGKGITGAKTKPDRIHYCKICGKQATHGDICQSCLAFLKAQKRKEALS